MNCPLFKKEYITHLAINKVNCHEKTNNRAEKQNNKTNG